MDDRLKSKWRRFLNNRADEEEITEILRYIREEGNEPDTDELNTLWEQLHTYTALRKEHSDRIYQAVEERTIRSRSKQFYLPQWAKAAAAVILIICAGISAYLVLDDKSTTFNEIATGYERRIITLTDGSEVVLNLHSKIRYPQKFGKDKRELFLEGDAFFTVTKDAQRPFIVRSGDVATQVIGTSFDISARETNKYEVAVATGKVKVVDHTAGAEKDLAVLTQGKTLSYSGHDGQVLIAEEALDEIARWKDRIIQFDNESMDKVLKVLGRRYGVKFTITNKKISDCRVSMKIENESLQTVMEDLRAVSNQTIAYEVKNNTIIVSGQGCTPDNH